MTDWRGDDYDRISAPHAAMGSPALDRLDLSGDERVLGVWAISYVRLNVTARRG